MKQIILHPVTTHVAATLVGAGIVFSLLALAMSQSFEVDLRDKQHSALCIIVTK